MRTRSLAYAVARFLGDVSAVRRGPKAIAKRIGNKIIGRTIVRRLWL